MVTAGLLATRSMASTVLNQANNKIGSFKAESTTTGNIELTSVGAIDIQGIRVANGNIAIVNTGGISTSGAIQVPNGNIAMIANSPLTIGVDGVTAGGGIDLTATNLTSPGNVTLNGNLTSTAGAISLNAAGNLVQNSLVRGALGVNARAGGSMTFGPNGYTVGNPVSYTAGGALVYAPGSSGTTSISFLDEFLDKFEAALATQTTDPSDPLGKKSRNKDTLVVEGETCKP
jgi:hypothetical protein